MASTETTRTLVVLNGPRDWDEWLEVVKTKAIGGEIWEFVDPSLTTEQIPTLQEPSIPRPADVNPAHTTLAQLTEDEKEDYRILRFDYKRQIKIYDGRKAAMANLRTHIQETISRNYLTYTFKCSTTHEMLTALKQRVAPTDRARKLEVSNRYQRLKKAPRNQNIDQWLQQWEKAYTDCKDLNLPEVDEDRAVYDFLNAISDLASSFSSNWIIELQRQADIGQNTVDLYKIVEFYRNYRRLSNAQKGRATHGAFPAAFQGQNQDSDRRSDGKRGKKRSQCLCGEEHRYRDCPYLMETRRPADWKPDPAIQSQIEQALQQSEKLRSIVDGIRKRQKEQKESQEEKAETEPKPAAFTISAHLISTASTEYHLRDSFILDSGANIHVCNSQERFQDLRTASDDDYLYAGDSTIPIEGFGTVKITVQGPTGPFEIALKDTAFVPTFHTNVASLDRFISKEVHWDTQKNRLTYRNETFCTIQRHYGQWTLEYNKPKETAAFTANSAKPKSDSEAPAITWHRRLGHIQPDAVEKLPTSVTGANYLRDPVQYNAKYVRLVRPNS